MLILFSMKQSFRLESRIFWGGERKKQLWKHCLAVPQDSSSLICILGRTRWQCLTVEVFLVLYIFSLTLVKYRQLLILPIFLPFIWAQFCRFSLCQIPEHSYTFFIIFQGKIWRWKTRHKWRKCKPQVEFHCVTKFVMRRGRRKVTKCTFVSDRFLGSRFFTAHVLNITAQNLPLFRSQRLLQADNNQH